jgi:hypothetical protein
MRVEDRPRTSLEDLLLFLGLFSEVLEGRRAGRGWQQVKGGTREEASKEASWGPAWQCSQATLLCG